jgi:hypothetical protein
MCHTRNRLNFFHYCIKGLSQTFWPFNCGDAERVGGLSVLPFVYAALLKAIRMPAFVARIISISRLNLSHLPRMRSETLD